MLIRAFTLLSWAICLLLVLSTGMTSVAFANHDGSHGSHCIGLNEARSISHEHSDGQQETAGDHEAKDGRCVQHSCIAVVASLSIEAHVQRLASDITAVRRDLLRASLSAESLHRPPIV